MNASRLQSTSKDIRVKNAKFSVERTKQIFKHWGDKDDRGTILILKTLVSGTIREQCIKHIS